MFAEGDILREIDYQKKLHNEFYTEFNKKYGSITILGETYLASDIINTKNPKKLLNEYMSWLYFKKEQIKDRINTEEKEDIRSTLMEEHKYISREIMDTELTRKSLLKLVAGINKILSNFKPKQFFE